MSSTTTAPAPSVPRWLSPETISQSFVVLLAVTVLQRGLGFVRGAVFANILTPAQLGLWDMTYGFVLLASPLVMLGLPACFSRYVPRYQEQGQLRSFVRRTLRVCIGMSLGVALVIGVADRALAAVIYGDATQASLGRLAALCLAAIVLFDILSAVFHGLRLFRVVSLMALCLNILFVTVGPILLLAGAPTAQWAATGFLVSVLPAVALAALLLRRCLPSEESADAPPEAARAFWRRMITYAFWIWAANTLLGLFQYVDRLMLIHISGQAHVAVLEQLGTYHVLRLISLLVFSVASVMSSVAVPHMGHLWESGHEGQVKLFLGAMVKVSALGLLGVSVLLMGAEGFLMGVVFGGKFSGSEHIMPLALAFSVFAGLYSLIDPYLLCKERVWLSATSRLVALVINIGLNALLIPVYQLYGAAMATAVAMATGTGTLLLMCRLQGWRFDIGLVLLVALPLALLSGLLGAALALFVALWLICRRRWLMTEQEVTLITGQAKRIYDRVRSGANRT